MLSFGEFALLALLFVGFCRWLSARKRCWCYEADYFGRKADLLPDNVVQLTGRKR
ncbi:MAG: hypothetical protein ACOYBJ_02055 [Patescibacteria group bacterium]